VENKESVVADIALLLEGTYPYVRGGVSSWVHQIMLGLPDLTFALVFLGGSPDEYGGPQYKLPDNVTHIQEHFLMQFDRNIIKPKSMIGNKKAFDDIDKFHHNLKSSNYIDHNILNKILSSIGTKEGITQKDFLYSRESWDLICEYYETYCDEPSYIDYFWSVRIMHEPIFKLVEIASSVPKVRALHSISTGYAGLLGSILHQKRDIPFILTEHGIYTKERKIDLAQADWIKDHKNEISQTLDSDIGHIRNLWIKFFGVLGKITYEEANPIISLYEGNRKRQITDGAPENKTLVIPNGIDTEKYVAVREKRPEEIPLVIGLIGRVVPIKDIKTYIRALRVICSEMPQVEGWIVGPEDENKEYVIECKELTQGLGLEDNVKFLGFQNIRAIFPQLGLMILTSISEALPLVILESFSAGVPCVTTDVGSCRELIEGGRPEDKALGHAGIVTPIADPESIAKASIELLSDQAKWYEAQRIGLERVERFYTQKKMFDEYQSIYQGVLSE